MDLSKQVYVDLFDKYYLALVKYASSFVGTDNAEDIVQDAFVELWERRKEIEVGEHISSLLYRFVYTKSINRLKHIAVINKYSSAKIEVYNEKLKYFSPENIDVWKNIENAELKEKIDSAIDTLPPQSKSVFKLSYIYGLKNKEIAETLAISLRTVEAHLYQSRKLLKQRLSYLLRLVLVLCFFN